MAGENNNDEIVAQLKQQVEEQKAEASKQKTIAENAESKFKEWADERGKERKAVGEVADGLAEETKRRHEAEDALKSAMAKIEEVEAKIKELTKVTGPTDDGGTKPKPVDEQIQAIQATLTDDELAILDKALEAVEPDKQEAIKSGGDDYLKFLNAFVKNVRTPESAPPPWRKKPAHEKKVEASDLDKLFRQVKTSAEQHPDGPSGGTPRGTVRRKPPTPPQGNNKALKGKWGVEE